MAYSDEMVNAGDDASLAQAYIECGKCICDDIPQSVQPRGASGRALHLPLDKNKVSTIGIGGERWTCYSLPLEGGESRWC